MSSFETAGDSSNDALLTGLTRLAVAFGEFRKETTERLDTIDARLDEYEHAHGSEPVRQTIAARRVGRLSSCKFGPLLGAGNLTMGPRY